MKTKNVLKVQSQTISSFADAMEEGLKTEDSYLVELKNQELRKEGFVPHHFRAGWLACYNQVVEGLRSTVDLIEAGEKVFK